MRGATKLGILPVQLLPISIHAPHAGCDLIAEMGYNAIAISIHAPHAGCDLFILL